MEPAFEFPGHQLPGGSAKLSPHHKWLATYGTDGKVMLRTIGQMVSNFPWAILKYVMNIDRQWKRIASLRTANIFIYFILSSEINAYQKQIKVISITSEMI